jgi:large subunit ribosomal protein L15
VPKRGFVNLFRTEYAVLNVKDLDRFDAGTAVTPALLAEVGLIRATAAGVKVLGEGILGKALTVSAHRFSKTAEEKIRAAGGTVEVIGS